MVKKMESKGARILALMLALIMIGSVLAYSAKQMAGSPKRELKYELPDNFKGYVSSIPDGAGEVIYLNFNSADEQLSSYLKNILSSNMNYKFFSHIRFSHDVEKALIAMYPSAFPDLLFLINVNKTKVFFTHESVESYGDYSIELNKGVALVDQISPCVFGTVNIVSKTLDVVSTKNGSLNDSVGSYIQKLPDDDYNLVLMFRGEAAKSLTKTPDLMDFYLSAYRINKTANMYEKVVIINFLKNAFFVESNKTEYYNYTNYGEGLSMAVMMDTNFTKLLSAEPEMRIIEIKPVEVNETK
ncbi:hypothetical protein Asulf_01841 [Archaeoglobus sulfaticallidus PM70-1]|uniref:Uncharacterized protein n=1 Tax=Archaeoglobus sulfaticallidus PM70-1 TaxID=387631 RepID=N0BNC2_9EURY|nr:hypothetical protein [Archaeoglobus sulfaticallidus]AGK61810.1 hypothetical protein Asulf_01841 [Archaeoglobus sulfaticallidus PM70-1]